MCDEAAKRLGREERQAWYRAAVTSKTAVLRLLKSWQVVHRPWYADNSREPLRDETLDGWLRYQAVHRGTAAATTSPKPQWSLAADFAALFDPEITPALLHSIERWQAGHLGPVGLARGLVARQLAQAANDVVQLPRNMLRQLAAGASSLILKGVIEELVPRILEEPAVLFISESRRPLDIVDDSLLRTLRLNIVPSSLLPDALIFDATAGTFWFVEVVATDGPIDEARKEKLLSWAVAQSIPTESCRFLTAFSSRLDPTFRRLVASLAWGTHVWFLDEPDKICSLEELPERSPD